MSVEFDLIEKSNLQALEIKANMQVVGHLIEMGGI
jgi:hypothetical protein